MENSKSFIFKKPKVTILALVLGVLILVGSGIGIGFLIKKPATTTELTEVREATATEDVAIFQAIEAVYKTQATKAKLAAYKVKALKEIEADKKARAQAKRELKQVEVKLVETIEKRGWKEGEEIEEDLLEDSELSETITITKNKPQPSEVIATTGRVYLVELVHLIPELSETITITKGELQNYLEVVAAKDEAIAKVEKTAWRSILTFSYLKTEVDRAIKAEAEAEIAAYKTLEKAHKFRRIVALKTITILKDIVVEPTRVAEEATRKVAEAVEIIIRKINNQVKKLSTIQKKRLTKLGKLTLEGKNPNITLQQLGDFSNKVNILLDENKAKTETTLKKIKEIFLKMIKLQKRSLKTHKNMELTPEQKATLDNPNSTLKQLGYLSRELAALISP